MLGLQTILLWGKKGDLGRNFCSGLYLWALLGLPIGAQTLEPAPLEETIVVKRFQVQGSTVFSDAELQAITQSFTDRSLTFTQLQEVSNSITKLYTDRGYITSGAFLPPQEPQAGVVIIQVLEGGVEKINLAGSSRLQPSYITDRLALATQRPLNRDRLLEALQVLQLNPLIASISAELSPSPIAGESILEVQVIEAPSFHIDTALDNRRSPGVGEFRRQIRIREENLTSVGDTLSASYTNTDGSNLYELSYTLPINPNNGNLTFNYRNSNSRILEEPFTALDILAAARTYEATYRQPILQTSRQELALGLTLSRLESETALQALPIPLSPGADDQGRTRVTVARFFQEYLNRTTQEVVALRSQFSFGVQPFAIRTSDPPRDSFFFTWQGQGQYVRQLAPDMLFVARGDIQIASQALVVLEQFGIGGLESVRGYRQDFLLTDNALTGSVEVRLPILRIPEVKGVLQFIPFIDAGAGWNSSGKITPSTNTIVGVGFGLRWHQGDRLTIRFDYGFPLIDAETERRGLQQNGLYFSLNYQAF